MNTAKNIFLAISIILVAIGAWPIAILTATVFLTLAIVNGIQTKNKIQELQEENQKLRWELEGKDVVQRVIHKTEEKEQEAKK